MKPRYSPEASADLSGIARYIAQDNRVAARKVIRALKTRCAFLAALPGAGRAREELGAGLRSYAVGSYVIIYRARRAGAEAAGIEVLRVVHGAQDLPQLLK